jgi:hypothetical protein
MVASASYGHSQIWLHCACSAVIDYNRFVFGNAWSFIKCPKRCTLTQKVLDCARYVSGQDRAASSERRLRFGMTIVLHA